MEKSMLTLGKVYLTDAAIQMLDASGESLAPFLARHQRGDRGYWDKFAVDFDPESLTHGQVASLYLLKTGEGLWIVTEADQRLTTVVGVPRTLMEEKDILP